MTPVAPVIAIVGRPNVGKSTLFNYLTRYNQINSREALVADEPGVTRDRLYGEGRLGDKAFIVVDTGGIDYFPSSPLAGEGRGRGCLQDLMLAQTWKALQEADIIFWMVDARSGLTPADQAIAEQLRVRILAKPIYILANKTDGLNIDSACADFYELVINRDSREVYPISAAQGRGIAQVLEAALARVPSLTQLPSENMTPTDVAADLAPEDGAPEDKDTAKQEGIKVAIIGRPNVGKSTLVNRIFGEDRVLVFDAPGTTRDSIFIPIQRRGKSYVMIDTAGVRRRRSIDLPLEKFSVIKTLQAIIASNVVVFVIDAREGIADQDLHLLGYIVEAGKALVIAVNKWDDLPETERIAVRKELDRRLTFVAYARIHYISALHGSGLGELFNAIDEAYRNATKKLSTPQLTAILERAVESHQPPLVSGRRIKLRYAHAGGVNPPVIVIHGNQTQSLPASYQRYLANYYREALRLIGTPIRIELKSRPNPFEGRKNVLTPRQVKRRKRLMKHIKKQ